MKRVLEAPDDMRRSVRQTWADVAPAWSERADSIDRRTVAATSAMLEHVAPVPGDRVLELGCGPGGLGLLIAERVGSDGEVVLTDVVAEMTETAAQRARVRGLTNVRTAVRDLEQIDEPDDAFDVVVCREALHLVPEPVRALREMARVARPGGRIGLTVWGPRERNPWLGVLFDAIGEQVGEPIPPPKAPHPFRLDDADLVERLMADADLVDVRVDEVASPFQAASLDEWFDWVTALAGPVARRLASLPDDASAAVRARAYDQLECYADADGMLIPGLSLVATARVAEDGAS